jgi:hypothetical protein
MTSEEEAIKHANETSALIRETTEIFRQSIGVYFSRLARQIRDIVKKTENGKFTAEGEKDLAAISEELIAVRDMITRHKVILERALKVAVHKGQAKAYERLRVALDRLREESEKYQGKLRKIASVK